MTRREKIINYKENQHKYSSGQADLYYYVSMVLGLILFLLPIMVNLECGFLISLFSFLSLMTNLLLPLTGNILGSYRVFYIIQPKLRKTNNEINEIVFDEIQEKTDKHVMSETHLRIYLRLNVLICILVSGFICLLSLF